MSGFAATSFVPKATGFGFDKIGSATLLSISTSPSMTHLENPGVPMHNNINIIDGVAKIDWSWGTYPGPEARRRVSFTKA
jgi:hypothetical protein